MSGSSDAVNKGLTSDVIRAIRAQSLADDELSLADDELALQIAASSIIELVKEKIALQAKLATAEDLIEAYRGQARRRDK